MTPQSPRVAKALPGARVLRDALPFKQLVCDVSMQAGLPGAGRGPKKRLECTGSSGAALAQKCGHERPHCVASQYWQPNPDKGTNLAALLLSALRAKKVLGATSVTQSVDLGRCLRWTRAETRQLQELQTGFTETLQIYTYRHRRRESPKYA